MTMLKIARASLRHQLDWRGPNDRPQGTLTLSREQAEALLDGPTDPVEVLEEIGRLTLRVSKEDIERCAEAGGIGAVS